MRILHLLCIILFLGCKVFISVSPRMQYIVLQTCHLLLMSQSQQKASAFEFSRLLKCLRCLYGKHCVNPDQIGAVCSGPTLFASILNLSVMFGNYLQQTTSADNIFSMSSVSYSCMVAPVQKASATMLAFTNCHHRYCFYMHCP